MTFKSTVASTPMPQVKQDGAFSSNLKHEGTVGRRLWHPDDLSTAEEKQEAETEYLDNLIKEIENGVQLSKERLAALEASQEPEKPPLDVALCEYYDQTFEHLMKAHEAMLEMPPSSVPPVGLDEEGEKLIAKAKEYLEDFTTQVCCTIVLKALTGGAEAHEPRGTAREVSCWVRATQANRNARNVPYKAYLGVCGVKRTGIEKGTAICGNRRAQHRGRGGEMAIYEL
ncbi:uncharacterized protein LOC142775045 [Rhipicephalus microplus]|uniref:uncharacterized protein LOC142775045 n=1 Tax=Rhipicephalus microplus TaxID=6941 RepID=UPI003F6D8AD5